MSLKLSEHHRPHLVPASEVAARLAGARASMKSADLDLLWVDHTADRLYLSGSVQDGVLLVPADGVPAFFVRKSVERAHHESPLEVAAYPGRKRMIDEVRARLGSGRSGRSGRLGLAFDVTPAAIAFWMRDALDGVALADATALIRELRAAKSAWEIDQIRTASKQVETMFGEIDGYLRPGMTELELSGRIEGRLRSLGHGGTVRVRRPGAEISMGVVVSGASALYPTNFNGPVGAEGPYPPSASSAGWRALRADRALMLDIVTTHNGYHADTTRTFFIGSSIPDEVMQAHQACLEVRRHIAERLRPGHVCAEVYREVSAIVAKLGEPPGFMGFGENRVKFFGHGVGLELDELPVIADRIDMRLEAGMVVAVEPKAFLEPWGPAGIEDTFVVTEHGGESLCGAPLEIRILRGA